jgi:thioredoxin reductase (NADPH)
MVENYDVIIIGSGPAGLTAGLYTSRNNLRTLILEKESLGGELATRDLIENYPGYPEGVMGPDLSSNMMNQVMNYGTEVQLGGVEKIEIKNDQKIVKTASDEFACKALIIASGSNHKNLGVPGEQEFADKGVFYCATCDGPRFANKVVAVCGGGDSGLTEALFLTKIVSKVIVLEALPQCTASKILLGRAVSNPKIEIRCGIKVLAILGDDQVKSIDLQVVATGEKQNLPVDGVFVLIGVKPAVDFLQGIVPLTADNYIMVNEKLSTSIPGIFAAGDVRQYSPAQISTAVGDGATAGISAVRYVLTLGK